MKESELLKKNPVVMRAQTHVNLICAPINYHHVVIVFSFSANFLRVKYLVTEAD
jgi:hypothetical protein